ncbi:MAG: hypothetical protein GX620_16920, partial [Chloroflexi bacterium]|nr:hypothetical protein [Chloroflexota bacterium]
YQEWRPFGETQRTQRRYVSNPEISFPASFPHVRLNSTEYYLRESEEAHSLCQKTAVPVFYHATLAQTIDGDFTNEFELSNHEPKDVIVKAYSERSSEVLECSEVDLHSPVGLDGKLPADDPDPRWAIVCLRIGGAYVRLSIEVEHHTDWGVFEVSVCLSNTQQPSGKRAGRAEPSAWR